MSNAKGDIKIRLVNPGDEAKLKTLLRHVGYEVTSGIENPAPLDDSTAVALLYSRYIQAGYSDAEANRLARLNAPYFKRARARAKKGKKRKNPGSPFDIYGMAIAPQLAGEAIRGAQGLVSRRSRRGRGRRKNPKSYTVKADRATGKFKIIRWVPGNYVPMSKTQAKQELKALNRKYGF